MDFFEIASLLREPAHDGGSEMGYLENDLGIFRTFHIHHSAEFIIREYSSIYKQDYRLSFRTEKVDYIEISFFLNQIPVRDVIDGEENEYFPFYAYVYHTPRDADVEILFLKDYDYRNLDIYLSLSFFNEWAENSRYIRNFLSKIENNQRAVLFPAGTAITPEVALVLNNIKKCALQGIPRTYYIKAQVHQLLSFLFEKGEGEAMEALTDYRRKDIETLEAIRNLITLDFDKFYTIDYLARDFGINKFKLKKGFKELFGKGLFEYSTEVRMKKAMELIRRSEYPLKEIAFKVGYATASSFSVAFKKEFGVSPARFRRNF